MNHDLHCAVRRSGSQLLLHREILTVLQFILKKPFGYLWKKNQKQTKLESFLALVSEDASGGNHFRTLFFGMVSRVMSVPDEDLGFWICLMRSSRLEWDMSCHKLVAAAEHDNRAEVLDDGF